MEFLSNGDFLFPFDWLLYWLKHFFIWSFQSGALNPDGIIRLPGRLAYVLLFMLFGNLVYEYAYIGSTLAVAFGAFWYFARTVLGVQQRLPLFLASLFFAINPIFLGNISKTGLVLAVAILPLCMALLYKFMKEQRFTPLILLVMLINIGLLHPFNFTVNAVILVLFFVWLAKGRGQFLKRNLKKLAAILLLTVGLNAYFIVPMASVGTLDKDALADNVQSQATDYTKLVDIANTGDLLTGFSMAKDVLKDYEFYNDVYKPIFFGAACLLYILLLTAYLYMAKHYSLWHRRWFIVGMAAFLALVLLAAVNFFAVDVLIKTLINLPAGWIFRSPLKWQLYIPIFMAILLVLVLANARQYKYRRWLIGGVAAVMVLLNGFILSDVYSRLLTPQKVTSFSALMDGRLDNASLLYVAGGDCFDYSRDNPKVLTELNQVLVSKNVQVKRVAQRDFKTVNAGAYNFVLSCRSAADAQVLTERFTFKIDSEFAEQSFVLYKNQASIPYATAHSAVAVLDTTKDIAGKYNFIANNFGQNLPLVTKDEPRYGPAVGVQDVFDDITAKTFAAQQLQDTATPLFSTNKKLVVKDGNGLFYKTANNSLILSTINDGTMNQLQADQTYQEIPVPSEPGFTVTYQDPSYRYENMVPNPSFETGAWQKNVGDCYAYDNQPVIGMDIDKTHHRDGQQSLQLWAQRHNACTGTDPMAIEPGQLYVLSFDYRGSADQAGGYSLNFNGAPTNSYSERLQSEHKDWQTITQVFRAPADAQNMELRFYAFPDRENNRTRSANYDIVSLVKIPDVQSRFFLTSGDQPQTHVPKTEVKDINPTKKKLTISQATAPFYVSSFESYHPQWQLHSHSNPMPMKAASSKEQQHIRVNTAMNAWLVDPGALCNKTQAMCQRQADGSYTLTLYMEFLPQRWFYTGLYISIISFITLVLYGWRLKRRVAYVGKQ